MKIFIPKYSISPIKYLFQRFFIVVRAKNYYYSYERRGYYDGN